MSRDRYHHLDESETALQEHWREIARVTVNSLLVGVLGWTGVTVTKQLVGYGSSWLLEGVAARHWTGIAILLGALLAGGLIRGLLNRSPKWQPVMFDGIDLALANYRAAPGDDASPRYSIESFLLALRKIVATLLTLGTGGSGGLEGPAVCVGEAVGAGVARVTRAKHGQELRTYQLAGIAAAISTLLNAPFTAALFALEMAHADRIIYRKLAYAMGAGLVAYVLNTRIFGYVPTFIPPPHGATYTLQEYALTTLVAVAVSAPLALGFGLAMKNLRRLISLVFPVLRGAIGSLLTGLVALALWFAVGMDVRHTLGTGAWTLAQLLSESRPAALELGWFLALAVVGKLLTVGLTVQSGGSAGLLFPSMFLGGVAGAAVARLLAFIPGLGTLDPALFVVVGIACSLVAMVGVPMAAIALVLEVFGRVYGPPAILACGVTYVLTVRLSVYEREKPAPVERVPKGDAPPQPSSPQI